MEVKINVQDVHLAEITESEEGTLIHEAPEHVTGAMEIGKAPQISSGQLYGDGKINKQTSKKVRYQLTVNLNKLPSKWRRYMEGVTVNDGVESGTSKDEPKPFAIGWTVEKTGGKKEKIWFLYCLAEPIQETTRQSEENINYSTDIITISALEDDRLGRYYTFIDTEDEEITEDMAENFFKKVQTSDVIAAT
jgi:phi13 family phage major tail protein